MYTRLQVSLWVGLAALALSFSDDTAVGQTAKKKAAKVVAAANTSAHAAIVAELHQAKTLLDIALRDYHGHRAHADHEVHRAIHLLHHGHHHKGVHRTNFTTAVHLGPITTQTQQASDMKLRQAQQIVNAAHAQLVSLYARHNHHHHREAAHMLRKASHHIDHALVVVQQYPELYQQQQMVAAAAGALVPVK